MTKLIAGFVDAGEFLLDRNREGQLTTSSKVPARKAVYAFIIDDGTVAYVGVSDDIKRRMSEYSRASDRHRDRIYRLIREQLEAGGRVRIQPAEPPSATWHGWSMPTTKGLEDAVREKLQPPWNSQGRKSFTGYRDGARKAAAARRTRSAARQAEAAAKAAAGNGKALGKRAAILAAAQAGKLPRAPDFSAATHTRFRPKLDEVVAMVKARDIKGLKAFKYEGFMSTSPKAIMRYRDLAIVALEAQKAR